MTVLKVNKDADATLFIKLCTEMFLSSIQPHSRSFQLKRSFVQCGSNCFILCGSQDVEAGKVNTSEHLWLELW